MIRQISEWWNGIRVARLVRKVARRLDAVERCAQAVADRLDRRADSLEKERVRLEGDLETSRILVRKMDEALDRSRAELRVAEETIKALVAANRVLMDRWDAESAVQVRRRAGVPVVEEE